MGAAWQDRYFKYVGTDGSSCWVWGGAKNAQGYGVFYLPDNPQPNDAECGARPKNGRVLAHRLAYAAFRGPPTNECLMHSCDRPECVNPWHMTDATRADNTADMVAKGRQAKMSPVMKVAAARGTRHYAAKLDGEKVRQIRAWAGAGVSHCAAARKLGVSPATVSQVVRGRTWRHVQ